jgi:hypothetical protein
MVCIGEEVREGWYYSGPSLRGAQPVYTDLAIETALTLRRRFALPLRQREGFVRSLMGLMGLALAAPDHTSLSRRQQGLPIDLPVCSSDQPRHLVSVRVEITVALAIACAFAQPAAPVQGHGARYMKWEKNHNLCGCGHLVLEKFAA